MSTQPLSGLAHNGYSIHSVGYESLMGKKQKDKENVRERPSGTKVL